MKLVEYSDSDESDSEPVAQPAAAVTTPAQSFQATAARKIRINLPVSNDSPTSAERADEQPPAKRNKVSSGIGGFNSLLPAPKRAATQTSRLQRGVSLRTSSEAVFSRGPPSQAHELETEHAEQVAADVETSPTRSADHVIVEESKLGNATRFKPLSVANNKRKSTKKSKSAQTDTSSDRMGSVAAAASTLQPQATVPTNKGKKRSLFSVHQTEDRSTELTHDGEYESMLVSQPVAAAEAENQSVVQNQEHNISLPQEANTLEAIASDLNLTAAQRRQLFGRSAKNMQADVNIASFNMDSEYAFNEQMRQSGQLVEHRAVKTIAAGKHSLQQLVNNARNNQESIEDKWAEGRRNRGEGGSKYGWSK